LVLSLCDGKCAVKKLSTHGHEPRNMDAREARELRKLQIQARLEADIKASTDFIFGRASGPTPNLNHVVSERAGKLVASACAGTRCKDA
jgi:hypothetical protein